MNIRIIKIYLNVGCILEISIDETRFTVSEYRLAHLGYGIDDFDLVIVRVGYKKQLTGRVPCDSQRMLKQNLPFWVVGIVFVSKAKQVLKMLFNKSYED